MNCIAFPGNTQTSNPVVSSLPIERAATDEPVRSFNDYLTHETSSFRDDRQTDRNESFRNQREMNDASGITEYRKESDSAIRNELSGLQSSADTGISSDKTKSRPASDIHEHNSREESSVSRKKTSSKENTLESKDKSEEPLAALLQILSQMKSEPQGKISAKTASDSSSVNTEGRASASSIRIRLNAMIKKLTNELALSDMNNTDAKPAVNTDKIKKQLALAKEISKLIDSGETATTNRKNLSSKIESLTDRIAAEMKRANSSNIENHGTRVHVSANSSAPQTENRIDILKDLSKPASDHIMNSAQGQRSESDTSDQQSGAFMKQFGGARDVSASSRAASQGTSSLPFAQKLDELIEKAHITVRDGRNGQLSMKMFPEHLGRVNVTLGLDNGVLNAKFLVDSNDARAALTSSLNELMGALENEGLSLGAFQVDVRGGDNRRNADESGDFIPVHAARREAEEAQIQYERRQSSLHDGSINLVV